VYIADASLANFTRRTTIDTGYSVDLGRFGQRPSWGPVP